LLKRLAALSSILLSFAACGDDSNPFRPDANGGDDVDANPDDPDAEIATTTHSATISILDVRVDTGDPTVSAGLGSGGQVVASFLAADGDVPGVVDAVGQIFDDRNATGVGCAAFVWDLTTAPPQLPPSDEGHGTLTITGSTQTIPACNFLGGDYLCLGVNGVGTATTSAITPNPVVTGTALDQNFSSITIPGATFSAADVGRYVKVSGATAYRNNGAFPIIGFTGTPAETLIFVNPPASAQGPDLSGVSYQIVSGAGPVATGPEFLADSDSITVTLDAPAADPFLDFTTAATAVGDNFSLTPAAQTLIRSIPIDGSEIVLGCNPNVFTHAAAATFTKAGSNVTITETGIGANTRVGAEVTIAGATTAGNNGPAPGFTITARDANSITYVNANGATESFDGATTAVVSDCGISVLTAVNIDFSDATLTKFISSGSGVGPTFTDGAGTCTVTHPTMFQAGLAGAFATVSGATSAGNNGTRQIANSSADTITLAGDCTSEAFLAATAYEVFDDISGVSTGFLMPDPATSHATKIGHIQCAALASQTVTVSAGASAALDMVNPARIRSVFVRGGLAQEQATNPTNVIVGHAVVGFTTID